MLTFKRNFNIAEEKKIFFTSGAIQYGLPLNESIEAEEFIWFRSIKCQRQCIRNQSKYKIIFFSSLGRIFFVAVKSNQI